MSGIVSVYSLDERSVADDIFNTTVALQHRGEEGYGIGFPDSGDSDEFRHIKGYGMAFHGLRPYLEEITGLSPYAALGHILYEKQNNLQPEKKWSNDHILSMAMDGVILGYKGKGDSVMKNLYSDALKKTGDFFEAAESVMEELEGKGPYNVTMLIRKGDALYNVAFRDPKGIRPLCIGKKGYTYVIASETKALDAIEADLIRDIEPGEVFVISKKLKEDVESRQIKREPHAHCAFEYVYFADPTSDIEGRNVGLTRDDLGKRIARRYPDLDIDLVLCSPDSGRGVALGFQEEKQRMNIEAIIDNVRRMEDPVEIKGYMENNLHKAMVLFKDAVIKNPAANRTFQIEDEETRKLAARLKFFFNRHMIQGKKLAVGDDSIVRGTVFRDGMSPKFKNANASEVSAIISCPPLKYPCVKDPSGKEFIAQGIDGSIKEIGDKVSKKTNLTAVCYATEDDLDEAIGFNDTCKACFNGQYPIREELLVD